MPHFFASNLRAMALPARTKNFEFIFEVKSLRDESAIIFVKSLAKSLHGGQKILLSKQKKGTRFLVKFNKHFSTHSKEIIKSALKEYAELVGAEIVAHNLSENKIRVDSAYMLDWRGICALLGGNSSLDLHSADFANLGRFADSSPVSHPKFAKNHESQTENPSVVDSANLSNSQNLVKKDLCEAPENSPASWCKKSESKGAEVPPADFLLEAEKRGSPPKSEKAAAFWRVGGAGRGVQPFLREKKDSKENAESIKNQSVDCHADSANLLAMTKNKDFAESPQDAPKSKLNTQDEFTFLEIGFGSGRHILHLSQKHPTAKIIGLEIYRPAISQVLRQIEILGLQNLYLASIDARVLCEVLPAKCLDRIYLHFPVPWDKNPQRRVLSAQFLGNAMRALKDDGFFELLTDSAEYFAFAKVLAKGYKFKAEEGAEGEVVSKYEARWRRQEKVIYRLQIFSNSVLGMQFRTCENFGESTDFSLVLSPKFSQIQKPHRNHFDCDSLCESTTNQTKIVESSLDSAESQNLNQNNSARSAHLESRPLRGAKNRDKASSSASADFLLEADKRGSPPKSEKAAAFWRVGGAGRGVQPFLREEKNSNKNAESALDSAESQNLKNGLPRRFCESARNDDSFLDSANLTPFLPTKICKKEYFLHIKNKYIFEGGVVLFASFGAYYAPSSAYFVICGNEVSTISEIIPTRANIDALGLFMELCFDN